MTAVLYATYKRLFLLNTYRSCIWFQTSGETGADLMAETKDYLEKADENGNINISEDVIASIAAIAASEVEGIAALTSTSVDIAEFLGKKSTSKGVKIQGTDIDIYISVKYGYVIPTVAKQVQDGVSAAIEAMAGLTVNSVNVHVTGIVIEKESKKQ